MSNVAVPSGGSGPQRCPRCQRVNPPEAVFCFHDGVFLQQGAIANTPTNQLSQVFVFASGRRCQTLEELVQACQYEWEEARDLLRRGEIANYLQRVGRMDLVRSAREAQTQPDPDIALYNFLNQLPSEKGQGPRLDFRPRRIAVGPFSSGEVRQAGLTLSNVGQGILKGKVKITEGEQWLRIIGPGGEKQESEVKTSRDQNIGLRIRTEGLAGGQVYSGEMTIITNGGIAQVSIRLELATQNFPHAPFAGARNPRELAEKMLKAPRQAVPLLESGEVKKWFDANGWLYPIPGVPARNIAAVQQFFEALGLSKPPPLELSERDVLLRPNGSSVAQGQIILRTPTKKWVYATVESNTPWLRVTTPNVSGPQQVPIAFEADPSLLGNGQTSVGMIAVRANAGQKFDVRVRIDGVQPPKAKAARLSLQPLMAGLLLGLLYRIFLILPADVISRLWGSTVEDPTPGSLPFWAMTPGTEDGFLRTFSLLTWWIGALLACVWVRRREGSITDLVCAAVSGSFAGLVLSATMGCGMILIDSVPRGLLAMTNSTSSSAFLGTLIWLILTITWWGTLGAGLGFVLGILGQTGTGLLRAIASPFAWLFRLCGAGRLAEFVTV